MRTTSFDAERAVIPPPRLRAKCLDISGLLRSGYSKVYQGLPGSFLMVENLQNPARVAVFSTAQVKRVERCISEVAREKG
jgi:hypothetical protein